MIGYQNQLCILSKTDFVTSSNEHSKQNFDPHSNRHSPLIGCSVVTEQDSKIECSDIGLSDNQVFTTGLENNLNSVMRLHDDLSSLSLECNNKIDTGRCYTLAFSQTMEEIVMKKIEISKETDELIRRMSTMGDTYDDVIRRGFTYLDSCSEFWNEE